MEKKENRTISGDFYSDIILQKLEEIEDKLRFLNNEIQNIKMEQYKQHHRFSCLVCALGDVLELDKKVIDEIINIDPDISLETDRMFRPIDDTDQKEWEEYLMRR